jgi:hypothetical protein
MQSLLQERVVIAFSIVNLNLLKQLQFIGDIAVGMGSALI